MAKLLRPQTCNHRRLLGDRASSGLRRPFYQFPSTARLKMWAAQSLRKRTNIELLGVVLAPTLRLSCSPLSHRTADQKELPGCFVNTRTKSSSRFRPPSASISLPPLEQHRRSTDLRLLSPLGTTPHAPLRAPQ